jgi:hypothetical protein
LSVWQRSSMEKIYYCEVRKLYLQGALKEWRWIEVSVKKALEDGATDFRCKDCHGAVKLHGKHVVHGPAPHIEHKSRQDSEYCLSGFYFKQNPGREPRLSLMPVK